MLKSSRHIALMVLAALVWGTAAKADTMKLFRGWAGPDALSPKVVYNPDAREFLILGQEFDELKSRGSGFASEGGGPWMRVRKSLGDWYGPAVLAHSSAADAYMVAGFETLRLDRGGRVLSRTSLPGFGSSRAEVRAAVALGESGEWFVVLEDCKYGFCYYGSLLGPQGRPLGFVAFDRLPFKDPMGSQRRWQVGYEPERDNVLLVWEDKSNRRGLSRSIRAHRLRPDGRLVGKRLKIVRDPEGASQPNMLYHPKRREWLIVYVQNGRVAGRLLRGTELTDPIPISGDREGATPSIAYSSKRDLFLVAWVGSGNGAGIHGQWIRASGRLLRKPFVIDDAPGDQWVAEPGYSACDESGACLVTWIDDGAAPGGIVRGRYVEIP